MGTGFNDVRSLDNGIHKLKYTTLTLGLVCRPPQPFADSGWLSKPTYFVMLLDEN